MKYGEIEKQQEQDKGNRQQQYTANRQQQQKSNRQQCKLDKNLLINAIKVYKMSSQIGNKKSKRVQMDFIQKITLSPFQKYSRFQRFPWKFVCHLLLIVLTTYQALKIVSIQDKHTRIQQQVFSTIYLQNDDGSSSYPYYSLSDFTEKFFGVMDQTRDLNQTLLQYSRIDDVQYRLEVYYTEITSDNFNKMIIQGNQDQFTDKLANMNLTQNDTQGMKNFLQNVQNMNLQIQNVITYISVDEQQNFDSCLNWTITISYSFESFANIDGSLQANSFACHISENALSNEQSLIAIHLAVFLISSVSLALSWKQVYSVSRDYMAYKKEMENHQHSQVQDSRMKTHLDWNKNWEELGFFDKMKFFDFWFVVIVTGNFFQLFGALVAIFDYFIIAELVIFRHKEVFIGFGVMLAWITILKYLQYSNNLNLMTSTLSKSWNNLFMFLLGVMPFFLGFVFLGQTIFWKYNKFQDTSSSVITLFSLLNGDIVNDTFLQTWAQGLPGQIYLIIFLVLFYTAVQNVFVTIIMEGYEESIKEREHKKMLQEKEAEEKAKFQKNLEQIQQQQGQQQELRDDNIMSPELSPEQSSGLSKIRKNGKKVDLILEEMRKLHVEINESELSKNEKTYLNKLIKDNLESISRNMKLQVKELRED